MIKNYIEWPILYIQNFKTSLDIWAPPNFFTSNKTSILGKFEDKIRIGRQCSKTCNIMNKFEKKEACFKLSKTS